MSYTRVGPFADGGAPYLSAATFNHLEDGIVGGNTGDVAPTATGVAATDTSNLQAAITAAQNAKRDLIIPTGNYTLTAGLTWNLALGNLLGAGVVKLNCAALTSGAALTITGNGNGGPLDDGAHLPVRMTVSGLQLVGPNTDSAAVDGILETDVAEGLDQGTIEHVMVYGFRDGITFGNNVWSMDHRKVAVANSHRYGINLSDGTNSGECITFTQVNVYGTKNTSVTGTAIYSPSTGNTDARFFGGSLDYNDTAGNIQGGIVTFFGTHIEDNSTGPMFKYAATSGGQATTVNFHGCAWDVSTTTVRDHIHEIQASTNLNVAVNFVGDGGGVYQQSSPTWLVNNSGDTSGSVTSTVRDFRVAIGGGGNNILLLGDQFNMLNNGYFEDSTSFVTGGYAGWTAAAAGTWTIGTANARTGNAMTVVGTGVAGSTNTLQKIVLLASRQPIRVAGWMSMPSWTAGSAGLYIQFFAADGATGVQGAYRIGQLTAASGYVGMSRTIAPPKGAFFAQVYLNITALNGTAVWDSVEAVSV